MLCRNWVICAFFTFGLLSAALADTLTLKDGHTITGIYLGGNARQIRMDVGDNIQTFEIGRIATIQFGATAETAAPAPEAAQEPAPPPSRDNSLSPVFRPDRESAPSAPPAGIELPRGTVLTVRMIDPVDSEVNRVGETFRASIDEPVVVGSDQVISRGADVVVKLVDDKQAGKISGRTVLTLDLVSVIVNGKTIDVNAEAVSRESKSRTGKSEKVIGGGAALGAIIGALAGGGKGAAIGAVTGAGAGTAVQVATKGERVKIPSETRLTFTLEYPVRL